ncbi:MAG: 16S rRNA (uracil1498-N3)-methyltransferase [Limisphaerales bacterium]|jgi:16S rRNA (uracil1498-N3)-methyltransferase
MPLQFYIAPTQLESPQPSLGAEFTLDKAQSHHLRTVMRVKSSDEIICFDGVGTSFKAVLTDTSRRATQLQISQVSPKTDTGPALGLALGLLKGQAMDRAVLQATELGAQRIVLVNAARSNISLDSKRLETKIEHWRRITIAACEQSGRLYLPHLDYQQNWDELIAQAGSPLVLQMGGRQLQREDVSDDALLLVGPEGGWDEGELQMFAEQELTFVSIAETVLRAETVPSVALGVAQFLRSSA